MIDSMMELKGVEWSSRPRHPRRDGNERGKTRSLEKRRSTTSFFPSSFFPSSLAASFSFVASEWKSRLRATATRTVNYPPDIASAAHRFLIITLTSGKERDTSKRNDNARVFGAERPNWKASFDKCALRSNEIIF